MLILSDAENEKLQLLSERKLSLKSFPYSYFFIIKLFLSLMFKAGKELLSTGVFTINDSQLFL